MKKLLVLLLALAMLLCFTACFDWDNRDRDEEDDTVEAPATPEAAFDLWFEAMTTVADKEITDATLPPEVLETKGDDYYDEYVDGREEWLKSNREHYGQDVTVTYEILEKETADEDALEEYRRILEEEFDIDSDSVKEAVELTYEVKFHGSREESSYENSVVMLKIDDAWYCYN